MVHIRAEAREERATDQSRVGRMRFTPFREPYILMMESNLHGCALKMKSTNETINKMNIYTRKEMPVIGPEMQSVLNSDGKVMWRLVYAHGRASRAVARGEVLHKWLRDHGCTRFKEDGEWKVFPEDPTYPETV